MRKLGDTIYLDFTVHLPTTGAVSDADELPTAEVYEDATDTTLAGVTVAKRTDKTGNYRVAVAATTGNGFEVGKSYNVVVAVVAGDVTAKAVIGSFAIDSKRLGDLNDIAAPDLSNLDAAVSSRSTLTAQQVWEYATRTMSSFGTLVADIAAAVWGAVSRSLTDKAGFSIAGTKQTLDAMQDLSQAGAQAGATAALNAYDPPTKGELDTGLSPLALEASLTAMKGAGWTTQTLVAISALVDDLEGRFTAARAGYLDELAATNIPADLDTLLSRLTAVRAAYLDASISSRSTATQGATKAQLDLAQGAIETAIDEIVVPPPEGVALEANVEGHVANALNAYDPPTKAELDAAQAAIQADIAGIGASAGAGGITWTYTLTRQDNGLPIADADVWITTDLAGQNIIASGRTDQNGVVTFHLDAGTVYVWRQKSGFVFVNPDTEVVS